MAANPNLQKIIKLTQTQYNTLSNGGTVGDYTGLNDNYLYLIQDDGGISDVQINGTSIISSNVANILTNSAYNSSTNKIATMSDLPDDITITTTVGSESVSDGTNNLNVVTRDTAQTITGKKTLTNDLVLYSGSGDSPSLILQSGELGDSLYDWKIVDVGGELVFKQLTGLEYNRIKIGNNYIGPGSDNTTDLGSNGSKFKDLYLGEVIDFGDNTKIQKDSSNRVNILFNNNVKVKVGNNETYFANHVEPDSANSYDLGRSALKWRNIFFSGYLSDGNNSSYGLVLPDTTSYTANQTIATTDDIPTTQETMTIVVDALTNLNGRTLSNYEATLTSSTYTYYTITYGGVKCTETQARNYMEYMTGSRYLPQYDYEKPKNSIFMFADRTFWKPQYDSTNGLQLYRLSTALALESQIPTVNNGTLSIQGNGTTASTFTANQSGNTTLNIKGSGATSVTKSADNEITISSTNSNDNQTVKTSSVTFDANDAVQFNGGSNITITGDASAKTMTLGVASGYSIPSDTDQASWSLKQDKLASQTAYTSQGSSTKVPQITTNSLGQVTGITEVNITAGLTWEDIYPIGAIYIGYSSTSPASLFGGSWNKISGKFLVSHSTGDSDFGTLGGSGGEKTHTLTVDEMPSHTHSVNFYNSGSGGGAKLPFSASTSSYIGADSAPLNSAGGDQPHNNLPPYMVVYMWRRAS